jgi:hypothetical protein
MDTVLTLASVWIALSIVLAWGLSRWFRWLREPDDDWRG